MLKVVENEPAIRRYQRKFVSSFKPLTNEVIPVELGHPSRGGNPHPDHL
jgi:hypothetical protein